MKYYLLLSFIFIVGCSKGLDCKRYLIWYESEENPLRVIKKIGDIEYTCTYFTPDYFKARELASEKKESENNQDESEYYKISIKIKDGSEPLTYHLRNKGESYERINYLVYIFKTKWTIS